MATITSTEAFDADQLDPDVAEQIAPLVDYIATTMQVIIPALQGGLGDKNMASRYLTVKGLSGTRRSISIEGPVSNVQLVRVVSQPETLVVCTGFNWWPTESGFDYVAEFSGEKTDRDVTLKVEFDL